MLDETKLRRTLDRLDELSIAVIGDLFLDKYLDLDGSMTETSIETGLDAYQVARVRSSPGAGGTVLNNLAALGVGRLLAVSVIGCDGEGFELKRALDKRGVGLDLLVESPERFTPTYTKPMLDDGTGTQRELNRLDIKNRAPLPAELESAAIANVRTALRQADGVIIADQVEETECGVVTTAVRETLAELAARYPDRVVLADSRARIALYRNVSLKPNLAECVRAATSVEGKVQPPTRPNIQGEPKGPSASAGGQQALDAGRRAAEVLARHVGRCVYCTLGSEGILHTDGKDFQHVAGYPVDGPIDIVGAGDATSAGIVCGLCAGLSPIDAAALGNLIASITIQQLGTTGTATAEQVLARWSEIKGSGS